MEPVPGLMGAAKGLKSWALFVSEQAVVCCRGLETDS